MLIPRKITEYIKKSKKSILLLGPRQTGKSTLIRDLKPDMTINLAREAEFIKFARNPEELEQRLRAKKPQSIFIDEVQKIPSLLGTVQAIIDESSDPPHFYLTGSSARKLKRGNANLLPGRIHAYRLSPLTLTELEFEISDEDALLYGTLPGIVTEDSQREKQKTLLTYGATYLKEEIQAESLTRNLEGFSRFLYLCAAESTKFLDFTKLASESGVTRQSAQRYFEILEETLIVNKATAFSKSLRKRLVQHPRYFFFDNGVLNGLLENFTLSEDRKGFLFENLVFNQIYNLAQAFDEPLDISTYRTEHGAEIDLIINFKNTIWAIELKSKKQINTVNKRPFKSFADFYNKPHRSVIAYLGSEKKSIDGIEVLPWVDLLKALTEEAMG